MKKGIHPESYRLVVFKDMSCDHAFLTKSTVPSKETIKWEDGNEYPLVKLEISDKSHPFYTGKMKLVDTAGRVDKFKNRYAKRQEDQAAILEAKVKAIKEAEEKADQERAAKVAAAEAKEQENADSTDEAIVQEEQKEEASPESSAEDQPDETVEAAIEDSAGEEVSEEPLADESTVTTEAEVEEPEVTEGDTEESNEDKN